MAFPSGYAGYDTITPANPASSFTDYFYIVNANLLSSSFWSEVKSDGGDIQAYKADGTRLPVYIHNWDYAGHDANLYIGYTGTKSTSSESIRIYSGNGSNSQPAAGASYGQYAVFPSSLRAFYPDGGGDDVTSYLNHLTMSGSPTVGGVSGPIVGSKATDYDGSTQYGLANTSIPAGAPYSLICAKHADNTQDKGIMIVCRFADSGKWQAELNNVSYGIGATSFDIGATGFAAARAAASQASVWQYCAATFASTSNRVAYLNGTASLANTANVTPGAMDTLGLAYRQTYGKFDGRISLAALYTSALSADWIAYWHAMLADSDQSDFYAFGGWTAEATGPSPAVLAHYYAQMRANN